MVAAVGLRKERTMERSGRQLAGLGLRPVCRGVGLLPTEGDDEGGLALCGRRGRFVRCWRRAAVKAGKGKRPWLRLGRGKPKQISTGEGGSAG